MRWNKRFLCYGSDGSLRKNAKRTKDPLSDFDSSTTTSISNPAHSRHRAQQARSNHTDSAVIQQKLRHHSKQSSVVAVRTRFQLCVCLHAGCCFIMAGRSTLSSQASSTDFSSSRVASNGNGGVVSSVIWLTIATGLCFPWLLEKPSASKAGDSPKAVAWFLMLALDLMIGTMSVFSLWFQKSTLSIMLLIWGSCGILGTFLLGSFAMLPAVATM